LSHDQYKITPEDIRRLEHKVFQLLLDILEGKKQQSTIKASLITCALQYLKWKGFQQQDQSPIEAYPGLTLDDEQRNFNKLELPYQ